jgi:hypothetical protein
MPVAESKPDRQRELGVVLWGAAWLSFAGGLAGMLLDRDSALITQYFMAVQDAPVLLFMGLFFATLALLVRNQSATFLEIDLRRLDASRFAWIAALVVGFSVLLIRHYAYADFALSADEFMAEFDARIIASGRLFAWLAPEWRDYAPALQPVFRLSVPDNAFLISSYLPVNAALRAVFVVIGNPGLEGAVLAAVAVVALCGVARRLWPGRPDAVIVSVVVLISSSQFLITAATPYAMTAHLALNLVWLWLFLRDTPAGHGAAAGVAFAACGLHQVAFHPLFAAPFVLSLFWDKRWRLAAFHSLVYAVSVCFWVFYWSILLRAAGAPMQQAAEVGIVYFIQRIADLIDLSPVGLWLMLLNLFRLLSWQSLVFLPLVALGLLTWTSRNRTTTCLALGVVATLGLVFVIIPYQGHGWGYRYLHGCLGGLALIAAHGWINATGRDGVTKGSPAIVLLSGAAMSVLVLLPWRAYQAHAFVSPYAAAVAAIERSTADVVVVDFLDIWFGPDLVRNDPFLRGSPKVLSLYNLEESQLRALCARHDVAIFNREDAPRFGLRTVPEMPEPFASRIRSHREFMEGLRCGRPFDGRS